MNTVNWWLLESICDTVQLFGLLVGCCNNAYNTPATLAIKNNVCTDLLTFLGYSGALLPFMAPHLTPLSSFSP